MQMKIMILNGPNLARLDLRDKDIYGNLSYEDLRKFIVDKAVALGLEVDIRQSDSESEIVSWIHEAADKKMPMIINPAAFTHYSYAIRDAAELVKAPLIEVHLSNPLSREEFRHTSVISGVANGTIGGFGPNSYVLAIIALTNLVER
jgi:3-dehydroquinate dehydratase-2